MCGWLTIILLKHNIEQLPQLHALKLFPTSKIRGKITAHFVIVHRARNAIRKTREQTRCFGGSGTVVACSAICRSVDKAVSRHRFHVLGVHWDRWGKNNWPRIVHKAWIFTVHKREICKTSGYGWERSKTWSVEGWNRAEINKYDLGFL